MSAETFNPYRPPSSELAAPPCNPEPGSLRPVPFEDLETEPRFWPRVWAMFSLLFTNPLELFARVPASEGLAAPWRFQLTLGIPLFAMMLLFGLVFTAIGFGGAFANGTAGGPPRWLLPLIFPAYGALLPLFLFLGMVIFGALNHFFLWIWGGLRQGEELQTTLRATGYFMAFWSLANLVPVVNLLVMLGAPTLLGMGLARMHRTDTWRGICAAYTPIAFCCVCYAGILVTAITTAATHAK